MGNGEQVLTQYIYTEVIQFVPLYKLRQVVAQGHILQADVRSITPYSGRQPVLVVQHVARYGGSFGHAGYIARLLPTVIGAHIFVFQSTIQGREVAVVNAGAFLLYELEEEIEFKSFVAKGVLEASIK